MHAFGTTANRPRLGLVTRGLVMLIATGAFFGLPDSARGQGGEDCLTTDPPAIATAPNSLRFGITPLAAGSAGVSQLNPAPESESKAIAALDQLRPPGKHLVMRLNRMFWADGTAGIRRYARIVDRYAAAGFDSELQVRYHPPPGQEGNMAAWTAYVRKATRILGRRPAVKALSITNEANFSVSPNTSDGSYDGVREAVVLGTVAAHRELKRIGRRDIELGFSMAWRWVPSSDRAFWEEIGDRGTAEFRRAVDYVGLQVYPHLVWPPAPLPGRTVGDEIVDALELLRNCYMPKADLGPKVDLWVTENGYPTNLGRSEQLQRSSLATTLRDVHRYSGELGVTDYRWFNLRDNNTLGPDLFDAVGILRDDYSRKPAFATLRSQIARIGTPREGRRTCRGLDVTRLGTPGDNYIRGTSGDDVIKGRRGNDRIDGRGGNDLICGGQGSDRISAGSGDDRLIGGSGPAGARDRCSGGAGDDDSLGCESRR